MEFEKYIENNPKYKFQEEIEKQNQITSISKYDSLLTNAISEGMQLEKKSPSSKSSSLNSVLNIQYNKLGKKEKPIEIEKNKKFKIKTKVEFNNNHNFPAKDILVEFNKIKNCKDFKSKDKSKENEIRQKIFKKFEIKNNLVLPLNKSELFNLFENDNVNSEEKEKIEYLRGLPEIYKLNLHNTMKKKNSSCPLKITESSAKRNKNKNIDINSLKKCSKNKNIKKNNKSIQTNSKGKNISKKNIKDKKQDQNKILRNKRKRLNSLDDDILITKEKKNTKNDSVLYSSYKDFKMKENNKRNKIQGDIQLNLHEGNQTILESIIKSNSFIKETNKNSKEELKLNEALDIKGEFFYSLFIY